ncbi:hypothetical protein B0J17DRAFT_769624 [Rhizoctonia solani]|nr:hypothetical protein B0J17DRAFT_769624 [Rhizoctonia solani]
MGTRGFMAYRYKGKYYRVYIPDYAHPSEYVRGCTASIPRDPTQIQDWLEKVARALESKSQWNRLFGGDEVELLSGEEDKLDGGDQDEYDSEDQERGRLEIIPARDCSWTLGEAFLEYIYVIDLDNRVFSFNGAVHFRLDNMPPNRSTRSEWSLVRYLSSYEKVKIPDKYLKRVDLWPPPRFDITQAQQKYDQLQPLIAAPAEWGVPSWDILTVPQRLATSLVEALLEDYTDE